MFDRLRRRYLDLVGSVYLYNEHRGYTALDRVLAAVRARWPHERALIDAVAKHRDDERKHYLMFRRWFERRGVRPFRLDRAIGHADRFVELMFGSSVDDLDTDGVIASDALFERLCRVVALTERRGHRQVQMLLAHPLVQTDRQLIKMFRVIERDEPDHWAPYERWLAAHGRATNATDRVINRLVTSELLLVKLPLLFLWPGLARRDDWPDETDAPIEAQVRPLAA